MTDTSEKLTRDQIYDKLVDGEPVHALQADKEGFTILSLNDTEREPNLFDLFGDSDDSTP